MRLSVTDMAGLRFAISPSWELVASLRALARPGAHVAHLPWVRRHRRAVLGDTRLRELVALTAGPGPLPGFLAAPPDGTPGDPAHEIDELLTCDPELVAAEIVETFGGVPPAAVADALATPDRLMRRLVGQMHRYWDAALASSWPSMVSVLETDLVHRGRQLSVHGPAALFTDLHPDISWSMEGRLAVESAVPSTRATVYTLSGRGLVLVPSVFTWPHVHLKAAEPWQPVVRYPARGVGALWESSGRTDGADLAASLGRTRARLLVLTEHPRTTTELARATGLAAGGISVHLDRLVRSGLMERHRHGRTVAYVRTPTASLLLA